MRQCDHGEEGRADQQHLLQDQHERRRYDVARIAADGIEDRLQQHVGRARGRKRRLDQAAVGARASRRELGREGADRGRDPVGGRPEDEEISGVGVDRNVHRQALEHVALRVGRNADHSEGLAAVERGLRLGDGIGAHHHADGAAGVQGLHDAAAELAQVVVDHGDRNLAQDLAEIGLRVIKAVEHRPRDQQQEGAANPEHAAPFGGEGATDARGGNRSRHGFRRRRMARQVSCERAQAHECEQRIEHGERREHCEWTGGIVERKAARRLAEQHGHVPAQRQDRAPGQRERIHRQDGKADARETKRGRHHETGQAEPGREVAHQELQQGAQREITDDEKRARGHDHGDIAAERDAEQPLENERHDQHDDKEDREQRC